MIVRTNNDKMNAFAEFQLNMTPGSTKMGTPILVKIPKNGGFTKMTDFSFFTRKCLFGIDHANCEN